MRVLDVYVMISMIFLCFKNLRLRNVAIAQASPVVRLVCVKSIHHHPKERFSNVSAKIYVTLTVL